MTCWIIMADYVDEKMNPVLGVFRDKSDADHVCRILNEINQKYIEDDMAEELRRIESFSKQGKLVQQQNLLMPLVDLLPVEYSSMLSINGKSATLFIWDMVEDLSDEDDPIKVVPCHLDF